MLGVLTDDPDLLSACRKNSTEAPIATRTDSGRTVMMTGERSNDAALMGPSGSLIGLTVGPPPEGRRIESLAGELLDEYLEHGPEFVGDRPGQFSIAVWDASTQQLHLYRDRIGVPPLFHWRKGRSLAWATSIVRLLEIGADRDVDEIALGHYQLTGYVQAPRTMVASVRKVPAAHRLTVNDDDETLHRYWGPSWQPKTTRTIDESSREVERRIVKAIERVVPRSGRLGLLLSGGIDSIGIAAASSAIADLEMEAFTFRYANYAGPLNEDTPAKAVAAHLGMGHTDIEIGPESVERDLPRLLQIYEEPMSYGIHSARMEPIRDRGIEVVLTGAEGATWATGRSWTTGEKVGKVLPDGLLRAAQRITPHGGKLQTLLDIAVASNPERYLDMSQQRLMSLDHAARLRTNPALVHQARSDLVSALHQAARPAQEMGWSDRLALLGLSSFGAEHLTWWSHRWAAAADMSVRFPLLDFDYIAYMARMDNRDKAKSDRRRMTARYLPPDLATRSQLAQAAPLAEWLRGPLRSWSQSILDRSSVETDGTFRWDTIEECMGRHQMGEDHKWCIWTSATFLVWKREILGRP